MRLAIQYSNNSSVGIVASGAVGLRVRLCLGKVPCITKLLSLLIKTSNIITFIIYLEATFLDIDETVTHSFDWLHVAVETSIIEMIAISNVQLAVER